MLGPFSVNAGWSQTQQNVTATPDAAEIVVPGGQGGRFERRVNTWGGGASFALWGLTLTGDYHHDDADAADLPDRLPPPGPLRRSAASGPSRTS